MKPRLSPPSLYAANGRRKYLTPAERLLFVAAARSQPRPEVETLCLVLAYTGCRLSEALALSAVSIEADAHVIAIRSLKKRGRIVVREIPVPAWLTARIAAVHFLAGPDPGARLWSWTRGRAWALVKSVMIAAGIRPGPHATAKGLRHAFGVYAVHCTIPLTLLQRWLGHARLETTAIYTQVVGPEERAIASRMWG